MRDREFPVRKWVLVLMILATTFDYRFLAGVSGLPSFTLLEVLSVGSFCLLFVDSVVATGALWSQLVRIWRANPYLISYFLWIAVLVFVNLFRGYGVSTMSQFKDLLPSIMLLVVLFAYGRSVESLVLIVKALMVGLVFNLLLGLNQGLFGWPRPVALNVGSAGKVDLDGRIVGELMATGWFSHPNGFAMFLIPSFALLIVLVMNRVSINTLWRLTALLCIPLLIFAMYKTQGKGAMGWAFVAMIFAMFPGRPRTLTWWLMLCSTVAGIVTITLLGIAGSNHFKSFSTIFSRIQLWQAAIDALRSDYGFMLFGAAFQKVYQLSFVTTGFRFPYSNAHNAFLNQAVSYGIPGLVLYLLAIGRATRSLCISWSQEVLAARMEGMSVFVLAGTFALIGEYFFEPAAEGVLIQAQFFLLLGLCSVLMHPSAAPPPLMYQRQLASARRWKQSEISFPVPRL